MTIPDLIRQYLSKGGNRGKYLWSQTSLFAGASKQIGVSGRTAKDIGCAIFCLTRVYNLVFDGNPLLRPYQFIDIVNKNAKEKNYTDWLTRGGNIYWNSLDRISKGKITHTYKREEAHFVLGCVQWGDITHWVLKLGDGTLCYNPYGGTIEPFSNNKWHDTKREIYYKLN